MYSSNIEQTGQYYISEIEHGRKFRLTEMGLIKLANNKSYRINIIIAHVLAYWFMIKFAVHGVGFN